MSDEWKSSGRLNFYEKKDGKDVSNSFSGNESNHMYLNQQGKSFVDVSGLSGLDSSADGRSFAYLDYDHDGWLDIVVASANAPQLQLFHNEIGTSNANPGRHVSLKLLGGNTGAKPSSERSNRDGYGAKIYAKLDNGQTIYREHCCGAGMAAQNSSVIHIGIGASTSIEELKIVWPSGKVQSHSKVQLGSVHVFRESKD